MRFTASAKREVNSDSVINQQNRELISSSVITSYMNRCMRRGRDWSIKAVPSLGYVKITFAMAEKK